MRQPARPASPGSPLRRLPRTTPRAGDARRPRPPRPRPLPGPPPAGRPAASPLAAAGHQAPGWQPPPAARTAAAPPASSRPSARRSQSTSTRPRAPRTWLRMAVEAPPQRRWFSQPRPSWRPPDLWAQVVEVMKVQPWIHGASKDSRRAKHRNSGSQSRGGFTRSSTAPG